LPQQAARSRSPVTARSRRSTRACDLPNHPDPSRHGTCHLPPAQTNSGDL